MISRDGRVKILDFGVAKLRAADAHTRHGSAAPAVETESGVIVGTAGYMAPEQINGLEADGRADVFALGAILFELLTGRRAFDRPSRAETLEATLRDDPLSSERTAHEWPPAILRIVQRCLEKDAEARFQSAADLAFALETVTGSAPSHPGYRPSARPLDGPSSLPPRCCSPSAPASSDSGPRRVCRLPATSSLASRSPSAHVFASRGRRPFHPTARPSCIRLPKAQWSLNSSTSVGSTRSRRSHCRGPNRLPVHSFRQTGNQWPFGLRAS